MHVFENKILLVKIYPALIIKLERKVKKNANEIFGKSYLPI